MIIVYKGTNTPVMRTGKSSATGTTEDTYYTGKKEEFKNKVEIEEVDEYEYSDDEDELVYEPLEDSDSTEYHDEDEDDLTIDIDF